MLLTKAREGDLIDLGVEAGVIQKSGAWFSYGEERLGQGRENVRVFLKENADLRDRIQNEVFEHYEIQPPSPRKKDEAPTSQPKPTSESGRGRGRKAKSSAA